MKIIRLSNLLGNLEEPVRAMASDEGLVVEQRNGKVRIRTHLRAGDGGIANDGEGTADRAK